MIFSSICEELGLFGAMIVLILFAVLLYRLVFIARNAPDQYGSLIVTGVCESDPKHRNLTSLYQLWGHITFVSSRGDRNRAGRIEIN